jgi:hypothetical protein
LGLPLIANDDVYRTAKLLIDEHGAEAGAKADERLGRFIDRGDAQGAKAWLRILETVMELLRERREGEAIN